MVAGVQGFKMGGGKALQKRIREMGRRTGEGGFHRGVGPSNSDKVSDGEIPVANPPRGPLQHGHVADETPYVAAIGQNFSRLKISDGGLRYTHR
ncbi:hypothetical protein Syun_004298 [Stephania yunnanensis]|uniref:Uncharacterized protein n=1 Tax=Stephania yunnanensis TaxID=152371 RepID=A0AAP0L344_9MAGN